MDIIIGFVENTEEANKLFEVSFIKYDALLNLLGQPKPAKRSCTIQ